MDCSREWQCCLIDRVVIGMLKRTYLDMNI